MNNKYIMNDWLTHRLIDVTEPASPLPFDSLLSAFFGDRWRNSVSDEDQKKKIMDLESQIAQVLKLKVNSVRLWRIKDRIPIRRAVQLKVYYQLQDGAFGLIHRENKWGWEVKPLADAE